MKLTHLMKLDLDKINSLGRVSQSVGKVFKYLQRKPIVGIPELASSLKLSPHTVKLALDHLKRLEIIKEITGLRRGKIYTYDKYLSLLREGDELLPQP